MQSPARLLKLAVFGVALVIDGILVALVLIYLTGQAFQVPLVAFLVLFLLLMLGAFATRGHRGIWHDGHGCGATVAALAAGTRRRT